MRSSFWLQRTSPPVKRMEPLQREPKTRKGPQRKAPLSQRLIRSYRNVPRRRQKNADQCRKCSTWIITLLWRSTCRPCNRCTIQCSPWLPCLWTSPGQMAGCWFRRSRRLTGHCLMWGLVLLPLTWISHIPPFMSLRFPLPISWLWIWSKQSAKTRYLRWENWQRV